MNNLSRALAVTLMAATIPATIVLAQQANTGDQSAVEKSETRRGPSPETIARLQDGRIAMAKTALKLSPDQEKLWVPVEEKIRAGFEERRKNREAWQAKREERRADKAKGEDGKGEKLALPERIEKRSERLTARAAKMTERAAKAKEFAEVLKPLYASFSEEQKAVASQVLSHFGQEGRGPHGHRWAMGDKRGHERGRF
jgi:hypothetical protein